MDLSPDEDHFEGRLLHQAALWDNVELLQELLSSGAAAGARDPHARSALHAAALADRSRCLRALCAIATPDLLDARSDHATGGKTALHVCAERGHVDNVRTLLGAGASLDVRDAQGLTPLALAERARHRHAAAALRDARDEAERARSAAHAALRALVSRGDVSGLRARLAALGASAPLVVNMTPAGAATLLYVACEAGGAAMAAALIAAGADGRAHPVTAYCPLYIASYHGHGDVVRLLLTHFPEAVQQETVEKWLPLHAACIGGHAALVTLLLEYRYPDHLLRTYTDVTGRWQYRAAFDVNARDASGQTALHVACTLGSPALLDALLQHATPARPAPSTHTDQQAEETPASPVEAPAKVLSPHRAGISLGIHAIVSKLTGSASKTEPVETEHLLRPVRVDLLRNGESCVAIATRGGHARLVRKLLAAGASADAPANPPDADQLGESRDRRRSRSASAVSVSSRTSASPSPARGYTSDRDGPWTALALAVRANNVQIAEMLLEHGATDPHGRALRECARHGLTELLAAILATKAYADPDFKVNKSCVSERVFKRGEDSAGDSTLTYSALCPATPVALAWRDLRCQLAHLRMCWLRTAALRVNSKLGSPAGALHALTRVDVANNELRTLPPEIFTLISLRCLNAAQNKLERLPTSSDPFEEDLDSKGRKNKKAPRKNRPEVYSAPVLQELYLQDNRLEEIPGELFSLPSLATLDVSNNKLRALPPHMWHAPALRDLSAALNHLKDLPHGDDKEESQPGSPAPATPPTARPSNSQSSSRSPSIEQSEAESVAEAEADADTDDEGVPALADRAGNAVWSEAVRAHVWRGAVEGAGEARAGGPPPAGTSPLQALNLAHNQFTCVPPALACRAPALTRLNMAYNSLRSMSYVTSYPTGLRQLDLSHNEITCWPSLPQVENFGSSEGDPLACYCPRGGVGGRPRPRSGGSVRAQLLSAACPARRHLRLDALRTLILSNNLLSRIQLTTDDDGCSPAPAPPPPPAPHDAPHDNDDDDWGVGCSVRGRLLFPLLSMLDVSCNMLRSIPPAIHELSNLAVLNISGNKEITELPPQMGLLSRLWNLNTAGCSLGEPLRSMIQSGRYKSMDVVGYLLSVLQEARPYTRCKLMLVGLQGIGKTSLLECLRQESSIQHRRKPTDHWARRMGNKSSRRNVSTVGVDIGVWVYEKQRSSRGPVTFRTWDFGGQHEYYATHQYFLSRRALYLVVWRVTDGRRGLAGAVDWLRSIQARAPGSPVIMVATHYDQVANSRLPESESPESLQRLIRSAIMGAPDADKLGLPRVLDSIEVSCSTRHNIRLLADVIYSVAFSVKPPGSKEPLLEQRVPATYLALEECVAALAAERTEPVLRRDEYRRLVTQYMQQKNLRMFRDAAELHQATMFLHENGVLLHYDDATLKELYFLRPQWLCDVLAHVVTVREINPFANHGIMKMEDLSLVLKASPALAGSGEGEAGGGAGGVSALAVALLNKFELALCWGARLLLVPPLLPATEPAVPQLPVRPRSWSDAGSGASFPPLPAPPSTLAPALTDSSRSCDSPTLVQEWSNGSGVLVSARGGEGALRRLLLLSYVPRGFWARLCTRLLADAALPQAARMLYPPPPEIELDESVAKALDLSWGWKLWKTGLKLVCGDLTLVSLRELPAKRDALLGAGDNDDDEDELYRDLRVRVREDGSCSWLDVRASACVEMLLPAHVCVVRRLHAMPTAVTPCQSISLEPNPETLAKVLALVSDHVDLLLEDWYPSLGTRFVHTSEGRCLITRVVPCPACLRDALPVPLDPPPPPQHPPNEHQMAQAFKRLEFGPAEPRRPRLSEESRASDGDSGVGAESNASSRLGSVEGMVGGGGGGGNGGVCREAREAHGWTVEECILAACTGQRLACPRHSDVRLRDVAPDTLLLDVEEEKRARWEQVSRGAVAGRGAFGTVLAGTWRPPRSRTARPVAVKALQPVPPPTPTDIAAHHAYKAAVSRWDREPAAAACRAYCGLRQELSILSSLRHPHVVPLIAVCAAPLALLLELAPQGALDGVLRAYRGCGARVGPRATRALALQVARALEYLHARRIVYRDLKSENVLVWSMPGAGAAAAAERSTEPIDVHVKLGDYGISRLAPPAGTKGFGGTEGFMAPEIMRYNGEEEYNEKVDCFSFGMVLFEVVSLRAPYEGHDAVKDAVLEGARPALTTRELQYPCCMLECLRRCWSGAPAARPSAAALVGVCAAPEFLELQDAAAARPLADAPLAATAVRVRIPPDDEGESSESSVGWEVWYGGEGGRAHALLTTRHAARHHHTLRLPPLDQHPTDKADNVTVTSMCRVGRTVWLGDSAGRVTVYSASSMRVLWSARAWVAVGGAPDAVAALQPLAALRRVALALRSGRLFLVSSSRPDAEGSFVQTELGAAAELCCLAAVPTTSGMEVWAGGDGLYTYSVSGGGVCGADTLPARPRVTLLAAYSPHQGEPCVFAYCHPGVCVYQWSARKRQQVSKLDCSKLAPCSESLQSIAIDDRLADDRCTVTALCVSGEAVYAGTAWGCVVVADAASLRPLTVFRPYEDQVRALIPLRVRAGDGEGEGDMLASLGAGYRPLLQRFAPAQTSSTSSSSQSYSGPYCLVWRAQHWLPD